MWPFNHLGSRNNTRVPRHTLATLPPEILAEILAFIPQPHREEWEAMRMVTRRIHFNPTKAAGPLSQTFVNRMKCIREIRLTVGHDIHVLPAHIEAIEYARGAYEVPFIYHTPTMTGYPSRVDMSTIMRDRGEWEMCTGACILIQSGILAIISISCIIITLASGYQEIAPYFLPVIFVGIPIYGAIILVIACLCRGRIDRCFRNARINEWATMV